MSNKFFLFKNFQKEFSNFTYKRKILTILKNVLKENNQIIRSLSKNYSNNYKQKNIDKYKRLLNYRVIGMGGSILGTQSIYDFLKHKIKKKIYIY